MPPEIETSASISEESEFGAPPSAENSFAGSEESEEPGFFSEEPILETSPSSDSSTGSVASNESSNVGSSGPEETGGAGNGDSNSGGLGDIGNGSNGSFDATDSLVSNNGNGSSGSGSTDSTNPFTSNNGNGSSGSGSTDSTNPFASNNGNGSSGSGSSMDLEGQESRLRHFTTSPGLKDIHFKFDRYDLDDTSRAVLRKNAEYLNNNPNMRVEIQGHCDERGTNNYNLALGQRRAHSTKQYLVTQGVSSQNVSVISYGEEKPFCFGSSKACWQKNRRAHFMVSK